MQDNTNESDIMLGKVLFGIAIAIGVILFIWIVRHS